MMQQSSSIIFKGLQKVSKGFQGVSFEAPLWSPSYCLVRWHAWFSVRLGYNIKSAERGTAKCANSSMGVP